MIHGQDEKDSSGCAISGILSESGERFSGDLIACSIRIMRERSSGLGGGFAAYGIYPEHADRYALHLILETEPAREAVRRCLQPDAVIIHEEPIPTRPEESIRSRPLLHRFFIEIPPSTRERYYDETEEDIVVRLVMRVNREIEGAFVISSGKNMGVFKGVGYPEAIARFFRIDEYKGYLWLAHGRFPTNTTGWWGGAHPFGLLDWAVVHNGEVSSYGRNRRYLENFDYHCTLRTDTEVICYLFDLLLRKHRLPLEAAAKALAPPFWTQIERMDPESRQLLRGIRMVYGGALLNGPFSVVVGRADGMIGLNDRTKLRPMVAARRGRMLYLASEEAAIREVCASPDRIWHAEGGVPITGLVEEKAVA